MNKNQKGFGVVEVIIVLVVVGLVGLGGWFVYDRQNNKQDETQTNNAQTENDASPQQDDSEQADETDGWKAYSSEEGKFSLRYPSEWVTASNIEHCEKDVLLLGTTTDNAGKCQSDAPVLVAIARSSSSPEEWLDFSKAGQSDSYSNITKTDVTVDGIKGTKIEGTYTGSGEGPGPRPGAKVIHYYFIKETYTYYATYNQNPTDPDVAEDFNLIVTKTLSFD